MDRGAWDKCYLRMDDIGEPWATSLGQAQGRVQDNGEVPDNRASLPGRVGGGLAKQQGLDLL